MHKMPRLVSVMTPFPHSVEIDVDAERALQLMQEHGIRHLPVTRNHVAYSLVSRDAIAREADLSGREPRRFSVADVCERDPYLVDLNTGLDEVIDLMAERELLCVVATRGERVAGVFTVVDVCRLLALVLRGETPIPDDVA
jgi:acetoin utilization protein AcuB